MQSLKNNVQLIGRLGRDPEIVELKSGKKLAKFSLATNDNYRNSKGEKIQETQWHNIVAWENKADFAKDYLKKGMEIALEGRLVNKEYEAANGEKRRSTEVRLLEVVFVGNKN